MDNDRFYRLQMVNGRVVASGRSSADWICVHAHDHALRLRRALRLYVSDGRLWRYEGTWMPDGAFVDCTGTRFILDYANAELLFERE